MVADVGGGAIMEDVEEEEVVTFESLVCVLRMSNLRNVPCMKLYTSTHVCSM